MKGEGWTPRDRFFDLLPIYAEGRVGQHVVEFLPRQLVLAQRIAQLDAAHVLPLDQHIALTDGVALGVQLLSKRADHGLGIVLEHILHAARKEPAGAGRRVIDGADDVGVPQRIVILHEDERRRQPHDIARRKVLTGGLVAALSKLADELFEHETGSDHLDPRDREREKRGGSRFGAGAGFLAESGLAA